MGVWCWDIASIYFKVTRYTKDYVDSCFFFRFLDIIQEKKLDTKHDLGIKKR